MGLLQEFTQMISRIIKGNYPDFLTKNQNNFKEIPVFFYHSVDQKSFEEQLQHLKRNNYETLNINDLQNLVAIGERNNKKKIILTFDDGLDNLYNIVYPLLRFYKYKAIAFIAPAWVGEKGIVNWDQAREMEESGIIDIQSHSYSHGRIAVSPDIKDFFNPKYFYYRAWQLPITNKILNKLPEYGMPIYRNESALSSSKKYLGDELLEKYCIDYVIKYNSGKFFKNIFWRNKLKKFCKQYYESHEKKAIYENETAQIIRIKKEIAFSKKIIEERLPGKKITSFSYPFNERSNILDQLLQENGYKVVFGGLNNNSTFASDDGKFLYFRRVNGDFVLRLPGDGRLPLFQIIIRKSVRRIRSGLAY